jgi:hypothetical protein
MAWAPNLDTAFVLVVGLEVDVVVVVVAFAKEPLPPTVVVVG